MAITIDASRHATRITIVAIQIRGTSRPPGGELAVLEPQELPSGPRATDQQQRRAGDEVRVVLDHALDPDRQRPGDQQRGRGGAKRAGLRGAPRERDHGPTPQHGEGVVGRRPRRLLHLVERQLGGLRIDAGSSRDLAQHPPREAVEGKGEREAHQPDDAGRARDEPEPGTVATDQVREPEQGGGKDHQADEADQVSDLPPVRVSRDRRELLRLVAARELLGVDQVVDEEQRRPGDQRRPAADPVQACIAAHGP